MCGRAPSSITPHKIEGALRNYHWWCFNPGGGEVCDWFGFNLSEGKLALRLQLWKWTGSQWAVCADTNWMYNTATAWRMDFQGWTTLCGSAYYGNMTNAFAWIGNWIGGGMWSGYQSLP